MWTTDRDVASRMEALHTAVPDLFLPAWWETLLPWVVGVMIAVSVVYQATYLLLDRVVPSDAPIREDDPTRRPRNDTWHLSVLQKRKLCFQCTNLVTNIGFGVAGIYCERQLRRDARFLHTSHGRFATLITTLVPLPATVEETIQGHDEWICFSAAQIGYQLWSMALFVRGTSQEPWYMLVHHATVICCATMSGCLQLGFRYWTPFFYGLVEVSSVPLAVMNAMKDHREWVVDTYPGLYRTVRLWFAVTFLYIRIVLFVPRQCVFLHRHFLVWSTRPHRVYQLYMATVWLSSFFLLVLQLYWAVLIVQGLVVLFFGSKRRSSDASPALQKLA